MFQFRNKQKEPLLLNKDKSDAVEDELATVSAPSRNKINVQIASGLIVDSFSGEKRRLVQQTSFALACMWWYFRILHIEQLLAVLLMLMSFMEQPLWCANPDTVSCTDPYYPNSQIPYVSKKNGLIFEAIVISVFAFGLSLKICAYGKEFILYKDVDVNGKQKRGIDSWNLTQLFLIILYLVDYIYACASDQFRFRLALFLRLALVFQLIPSLRHEERLVVMVIPKFLKTMLMVFLLLLLYAFFGVALFEDDNEGTDYFPNLVEGMWSLMILLTTANYPDVMMPAYSSNRLSSLFFVSFLLLGLFFLMNLLLAQVYSSYEEEKDNMYEEHGKAVHYNLERAFQIMTEDQNHKKLHERELRIDDIMAIFKELNTTHRGISHISEEEAQEKFRQLDQDGSQAIDLDEFYCFVEILKKTFVVKTVPSMMARYFPGVYKSEWFQQLKERVESHAFEYFIDFCLVLNGFLVIYQVRNEMAGIPADMNDGKVDTWMEAGEVIFTTIYFAEMVLKIWVMGFHKYTRSYKNIFDGVVTMMGVVAAAYVYYPNSFSDSRVIRYVVFCRILRLVRLVTNLPVFREIGDTFVSIVPVSKRLLASMFCIMYFFSWLGMEFFGGKINTDPDSPYSALLEGTDFDADDYYANNFNDLGSGMITLFELLVVNNWFVIVDGYVAVTNKYSRLFFILFYCIGVLIRLNIVVAFVLDNYNQFEEKRMKTTVVGGEMADSSQNYQGSGIEEDIPPSPQLSIEIPSRHITNRQTERGMTKFELRQKRRSSLQTVLSREGVQSGERSPVPRMTQRMAELANELNKEN